MYRYDKIAKKKGYRIKIWPTGGRAGANFLSRGGFFFQGPLGGLMAPDLRDGPILQLEPDDR